MVTEGPKSHQQRAKDLEAAPANPRVQLQAMYTPRPCARSQRCSALLVSHTLSSRWELILGWVTTRRDSRADGVPRMH